MPAAYVSERQRGADERRAEDGAAIHERVVGQLAVVEDEIVEVATRWLTPDALVNLVQAVLLQRQQVRNDLRAMMTRAKG